MTSICLRPARHAKHVRGAPCLATRIVSDQPSLRLAGIPEKTTKFTPPAHFGAGADRVASVKFVTPERVYLTGSVANGGCLRISPGTSSAVADVAVEVPKGYYAEKDYLDHRYHAKRFAYLQLLQQHLSRAKWVASASISAHHGDMRKPCLLVSAAKTKDVCLRVLLTAPRTRSRRRAYCRTRRTCETWTRSTANARRARITTSRFSKTCSSRSTGSFSVMLLVRWNT